MFTVAALFSLNYIVSKVAMHSFAALSFAWLRVAGAAIVLNVFNVVEDTQSCLSRHARPSVLQ